MAARNNSPDIAKLLITSGADVNSKNKVSTVLVPISGLSELITRIAIYVLDK